MVTPTVLLILDGWGQAPASSGNAVALARTPTIDSLMASAQQSCLICSGRDVGLPDGYMGNSEVGHLNIGAGRTVYQDITRIDIAIENGEFFQNPAFIKTINATKASGGTLHLMGLLSDGGVHSHIRHLLALLDMCADVPVAVHAFMDGRDTSPDAGAGFMQLLLSSLPSHASLATVTGRFYAMDRDKRWERTKTAWQAIVHGQGRQASDENNLIATSYADGITDEFIKPTVVRSYSGIHDGDAIIMFNFRADRIRQLTHALFDTSFSFFERGQTPNLAGIATMTQYESSLTTDTAFAPQVLTNCLGEVISQAGLQQLRIAETEKYAHVTYFFNGGLETPFPGEHRELVPSPRDVATYDLKPEMSAVAVTDKLVTAIAGNKYTFHVCNLANMDMVGHTGNIPATITACETVDACVAKVVTATKARKGILFVTADHGNAEEMYAKNGSPHTAHSKNTVALLVEDYFGNSPTRLAPQGKLGDIAPTILHLMGIAIPTEMTGTVLCEEK